MKELWFKDITYCPVHHVINKQCCGGPKEVWGTMETATKNYKEWKGGIENVQD